MQLQEIDDFIAASKQAEQKCPVTPDWYSVQTQDELEKAEQKRAVSPERYSVQTLDEPEKAEQKRPVSPEKYSVHTQDEPKDISRELAIAIIHKMPKMNALWVQGSNVAKDQNWRPQTPEPNDEAE